MKNLLLLFYCLLLGFAVNAQYLQWNSLIEKKSGGSSNVGYGKMNDVNQLVLSGEFSGNIDLDPNPNRDILVSSSTGNNNLFVSVYDQEGSLLMGNSIWSRSNLVWGGLTLDAQGSIYISGIFNDTVDLNMNNSQALYAPFAANAEDAFIVKYNAQGAFQWARQLVSSIHTYSRDMELDQSGNIFLGFWLRVNDRPCS